MSWMTRCRNVFRRARLNDELDEELAAHLEEATERGRSPEEARRAFGPALRHREAIRDIKLLPWLDALMSDVVFGWRQLHKHRTASAVAILSLALAIGATTVAVRLVDAVLLRTLPVAEPHRLFFLTTTVADSDGQPDYREFFDYPTFRQYSKTVGDRAELIVVGMSYRRDVVVGAGDETEKAYQQYVSGNLFGSFSLQPALGRLLGPTDDRTPGGHPVAVLSYDYWTRRFGRDPSVIGTTLRMGTRRLEVVGVSPKGFIGTEPGTVTDVFVPSMMNAAAINSPGWVWFRIWVRPRAGVAPEEIRQILQAAFIHEHRERVKSFRSDTPQQNIDAYLAEEVRLLPAASGASATKKNYRRPLLILTALVTFVLLIACANVANLLTAQAMVRAREMSLRVSIGAGRWRLVQLVLVESALVAILASTLGTLFARWSAPFVVSMLSPPEDPVRLILDTDGRALAFGVALTVLVTLLFGLAPALRASSVKPLSALKGSENSRAHRRLTHALIAVQMAFCVFVLFVAGLFVATFERLSHRPLGFSHDHILVLETESGSQAQPPEVWAQVADHVRRTPGVESVALSGWAPLTGNRWTGAVRVGGHALEARAPYFLDVSPAFFETMRIGLVDGRDFRAGDAPPRMNAQGQPLAGVGIVNEAFARVYFGGQNPVGRSVGVGQRKELDAAMEIVGLVRDASYGTVREPVRPTVYVPAEARSGGSLIVRTAGDPLALAPALRREVSRARAEFHVGDVETQSALVRRHMIRERLLATLSMFFALVALVLAGIGLYGVLNYAVIQQRREIGIRMALGARAVHLVRRITTNVLGIVCLGSLIGVAGGVACGRFVETLLFEVKTTDPGTVLTPILALAVAALVAALLPAIRACGSILHKRFEASERRLRRTARFRAPRIRTSARQGQARHRVSRSC
jgi:putative ABC transport system permease protein